MGYSHDLRSDFAAYENGNASPWNQELEASYTPDIAEEIDTKEEVLAEKIGVNLEQAKKIMAYIEDHLRATQGRILGGIITLLLEAKNPLAVTYGFAFAAGLDQLNGARTQTEVAASLGCTRALLSYYTNAARDVLNDGVARLECYKFKKSEMSRDTFRACATDPFTAAKRAAVKKIKTCNS